MTYRELLHALEGFTEEDLAKPAQVLIADQVIAVVDIHDCGCADSPLLDVGPIAMPAGRA